MADRTDSEWKQRVIFSYAKHALKAYSRLMGRALTIMVEQGARTLQILEMTRLDGVVSWAQRANTRLQHTALSSLPTRIFELLCSKIARKPLCHVCPKMKTIEEELFNCTFFLQISQKNEVFAHLAAVALFGNNIGCAKEGQKSLSKACGQPKKALASMP